MIKLLYSLSNEVAKTPAPVLRVAKGRRWVPADKTHKDTTGLNETEANVLD